VSDISWSCLERSKIDIQGQSVVGHVWSEVKYIHRISQYLDMFPKDFLLHILQDFYIYLIYCMFNEAVGTASNDNIFIYL
jgi:hypothetical protein